MPTPELRPPGADQERDQIATWIEKGPHDLTLDDATCRWLAVQLRLNAHRAVS